MTYKLVNYPIMYLIFDFTKKKIISFFLIFRPKPIADPNAAPKPVVPTGASAWNAARTFESCEFSNDEISAGLSKIFVGVQFPLGNIGTLSITGLSKVDGEASLVVTRSKKCVQFEFNKITFTFNCTYHGVEYTGTIEFPEFDCTDYADFTIKSHSIVPADGRHKDIEKHLRGHYPALRKYFDSFLKHMVQ